jgi:hypothetical protein
MPTNVQGPAVAMVHTKVWSIFGLPVVEYGKFVNITMLIRKRLSRATFELKFDHRSFQNAEKSAKKHFCCFEVGQPTAILVSPLIYNRSVPQ